MFNRLGGAEKQRRGMHLLSLREVPAWVDANPFILSGYRPESQSWVQSLASWTYPHNETCNIYSHLVPGLILALGLGIAGLDLYTLDGAIIALHLTTAIVCLSASTFYHTVLNHSEQVASLWLNLDYVGILVLTLGNFISGLHFAFYCDPQLKLLYWSSVGVHGEGTDPIIAASAGTGLVLLGPWFRAPEWRTLRLASFIATGMSAFAPIGHAWYLWGYHYLFRIGVPYYLLEGALLLTGCYIYLSRLPESLYPGRFDIWGHSHTLWHIFVVLSIVAHLRGLQSAWEYNHHATCIR
ncbi:hypothetical protein N7462_001134 [Penicillium macrosclerotiorum]|uniref:uncharacterized protein n=1 Tax=Penicillium macrosclerotiorum TaxID=303699 RepID=UPI002547D0D0|nr:uncharacterized protein N7462_001134 [Penicillium macrosclerotiorum]KAJ5699129.1 hypothetical protein N7462_001134 [Penicillium macrosclerotiorum]